jgi:lipoate-protein ligase B
MNDYSHKKLYVIKPGLMNYKEAWDLQKRLVKLRALKKLPDCLIITEHEPVITMGRSANNNNLLVSRNELADRGIEYFYIERGGDITAHNPGQVVAYPIIDLSARGKDLHQYLRDLETVVIDTLAEFDIKASTRRNMTGAWVNSHKLAAIGVAVSSWVSYHGLALNVENDLELFKLINPCGITGYPVGSISSILGKKISADKAAKILIEKFAACFGYETESVDNIDSLIEKMAAA